MSKWEWDHSHPHISETVRSRAEIPRKPAETLLAKSCVGFVCEYSVKIWSQLQVVDIQDIALGCFYAEISIVRHIDPTILQ